MKYKLLLILPAALLCVAGCAPAVRDAGRAPAEAEERPATDREVRERYSASGSRTFLDTLNRGKEVSLAADDLSVLEVEAASPPPPAAAAAGASAAGEARFRIQILASSQVDMVRREKLKAESATSLPVSMASEQSLYKLYVGDFKLRSEAEAALPEIRKSGYKDAWIVNTGK